jgi:cell division septum initiation protein DivIVA
MNDRFEREEEGIDSLRSRMDADARFRRSLSGYDPQDVRNYVDNVKRIFAQQAMAAKREQEDLISQLDSAKSEIQAKNYGIRKMKELLIERETQLNTANTRINALAQAVKKHIPEREELEFLRQQAGGADVSERIRTLETETRQLRASMAQASKMMESWKVERGQILEENGRLRREVQYLRANASAYAPPPEGYRPYAAPAAPLSPPEPPVRQPYVEPVAAHAAGAQQAEFSQTVDKLAMMFAEAYRLVSLLKTSTPEPLEAEPEAKQPPRPAQPYMQILRPEGTTTDNPHNRK